jgi:ADP-heptose:LPS heptosyltransferase
MCGCLMLARISRRLLRVLAAFAHWGAPLRTLRQLFGWRPAAIPLAEAKRILVIRPDEIGDAVLTGPFLRELRHAAPNATIALIVKMVCRELVEYCPYVDAVYGLDFTPGGSDGHRLRLCLAARRLPQGYDIVLLPRCDVDWYDSQLVGHLLAGRGALVVHRDTFVQRSFKIPNDPPIATIIHFNSKIEHEAVRPLRFLCQCGAEISADDRLEVWPNEDDRNCALLLVRQIAGDKPLMVLHPSGGNSPLKRWPSHHYHALLDWVEKETPCKVLIVGGKDESWIAREFSSQSSKRIILAPGILTLRQLSAVFERAVLFVGGDSGPMHLAAAAGAPTIGIFGPTSEVRYGPLGTGSAIISQRYACSPDALGTFIDRCSKCIYAEPRCLTELPVELVIAKIQHILARAPRCMLGDCLPDGGVQSTGPHPR